MSDLPGIVEAWHREALRRAEELDLGLVDTVSAEEVRCAVRKLLVRPVSEVIGPLPKIAPKKHTAAAMWQGGMRRRGRPI